MATETSDNIDKIHQTHQKLYQGAGGTPGGTKLFFVGLVLAALGLYLFLDSVRVTTMPMGWLSGRFNMHIGGGQTTSTGIIFAPVFLGLVILFYNAKWLFGWALFYIGLAIIVIEILSRIQFMMETKTSLLLLMLGMIAAGIGLMLRSFKDVAPSEESPGTRG